MAWWVMENMVVWDDEIAEERVMDEFLNLVDC